MRCIAEFDCIRKYFHWMIVCSCCMRNIARFASCGQILGGLSPVRSAASWLRQALVEFRRVAALFFNVPDANALIQGWKSLKVGPYLGILLQHGQDIRCDAEGVQRQIRQSCETGFGHQAACDQAPGAFFSLV